MVIEVIEVIEDISNLLIRLVRLPLKLRLNRLLMSSITSITINLRLDRLLISSITSIFDHKSSIDLTLIVIDYFDYYRLFAYFLCKCLSLLRRGSRQAGGLILFFLFTILAFRPILCPSRKRVCKCNQVKTTLNISS